MPPSSPAEVMKENQSIVWMLLSHLPAEAMRKGTIALSGGFAEQMYAKAFNYWVSDLDLFVTGEDSADRQFLDLVKQLEDNLRKSGYGIIKKIQCRWGRYNEVGDRALYVIDFTINGIHPKLQVIQTDLCDIQEVIDQFDIDIVSVVYDVVNDDFQLSGEVKEAITNRVASIRPFLFHSYDVSKSDLDKFKNSMK